MNIEDDDRLHNSLAASSMDNLIGNTNENLFQDENESQEEQPTEAIDNTDLPNQIQTHPVETTVNLPYLSQASQDRTDICSPSHEIEQSSNENFNAFDFLCNSKPSDSSTIVCNESLCVPYTDEQDEIVVIKQTSITTEEYKEIKKDKNNLGHIMISYNHSTKSVCSKIAKELKNLNYIVWIDQDNISGDILTSMASAIENAFVVLMAINEQYYRSRYCRLEAEYSVEQNKKSIPMLMQAGYKAEGWLGLINGSKFHVDFSTISFNDAFALLRREIEAIQRELGVELIERTTISTNFQSITTISTMINNPYANVHDWNSDDVIDWLHREKLEVFQIPLTCFTGALLWQLYKIKFDSVSDYYRTVETLLDTTIPLRLFYILQFHAAIETLFTSSSKSKWDR